MMNKESYFQHLFFDRLYIAKKLGLNTEFLLKYWESTKITNDINEVIEICKAFDTGIDEYFASEVDAANFEAKLSANKSIDMFDPEVFGNNIREFRLDEGMSVTEFAEKLGTTERIIQYYEAGQRTPRVDMLIDIAVALKVPVSYLLSE